MTGQEAVNQLVAQRNGEKVNITGADNGQCTAIAHAFELMLSIPLVYGNAVDTYANADPKYYVKTLNTPTNFPLPGSIVVFEANNAEIGTGAYGHTGVVVSADVNTLDCFEQNDEPNPLAHTQHHPNYAGVKGWFYPKVLTQAVAVTVTPPAPKTVTVTAKPFLNLRTEPSSQAPIANGVDANGHAITSLPFGVAVPYTEVVQGQAVNGNSDWLKSVHGNYFWAGGTNYSEKGGLRNFLGKIRL